MSESRFIEDRAQTEKIASDSNAPIKRQVFVCSGEFSLVVGAVDVKKAFEEKSEAESLRQGKVSEGGNPAEAIVLTDLLLSVSVQSERRFYFTRKAVSLLKFAPKTLLKSSKQISKTAKSSSDWQLEI